MIPSSLPLVVGGLRVSLCVGWMVLVASAMLARNPGLGTFVRDMFLQQRAARSPAQIIVAVFTVGGTAVLLDRLMGALQRRVRYDAA